MADAGPDTILLDVFRTNQLRERLIATALEGLPLPPEDYPFYVLVGAEGPLTPTALAARTAMPLSTVLYRVGRLERRGHAERKPNPDDRRSYLLSLTADGQKLLRACTAALPRPGRSGRGAARRRRCRPSRRSRGAAGRDRDRAQP